MTAPGIERLYVYPTTAALKLGDLCAAREIDGEMVQNDLMVDWRGVNPPWEDAVTMAVNAAKPMLQGNDLDEIGLLVVGSETGVDQEKPISSWVHRYLDLGPHCRNFEVKHACYGTTGALQMALAWLSSGLAGDRKALVINSDQSLLSIGAPWEPVTGAGSVAMLLSNTPRLVAYDPANCGLYSAEITDVMRPTPRLETGNSESSLFSYLEALEGAFEHYVAQVPEAQEPGYFDWNVYHMPFPGMALRAHRARLNLYGRVRRSEAKEDFECRAEPSIRYARQMGGVYGASTFVGLLGLAGGNIQAKAGDRLGIFAYGAGSCAEYYSATWLAEADAVAVEADLQKLLDGRRRLTVEEYETAERERDRGIMAADFVPDRNTSDWFADQYAGQELLILEEIQGHYRKYGWS